MNPKLIACVLGGTAHRARTELHDVAFAVGDSLDAVYDQLLDSWFGEPHGLHVDAWCYVDQVAGYRVRLSPEPANNGLRLYFVNIGGYRKGEFGERHAWGLFGAANADEVKARATSTLLTDYDSIHEDDLHAVDDCLPVEMVGGWHVQLTPDPEAIDPPVENGLFPLPPAMVSDWIAERDALGLGKR